MLPDYSYYSLELVQVKSDMFFQHNLIGEVWDLLSAELKYQKDNYGMSDNGRNRAYFSSDKIFVTNK